ncbi:class II glutamine amidotransferase [Neptuniibacter sp. QD37_6]|uniref:class II glutamine amidotransferase n=1 Tax=Neptuniibacter sp. QD37_6 TaxID=3398210 RepID=UPI0039F52376
MKSPQFLSIVTSSPVKVRLTNLPEIQALGITTICESNLQRFTAMDNNRALGLAEYLAENPEETEVWSAAFYPELPLEAVEIQPYSRAQRGLPCLFSQVGELPGIEDGDRFPVGDQWPLSCSPQERAFSLLQERMRKLWSEGRPDAEMKLALVADYAGRLNRLSGHHFIHWDGELLFAYSGNETDLEPLAYQSFSFRELCLNYGVDLELSSEDLVTGVIVASQSLLGDEAITINPGNTLCFRQGQLFEQCEPVSFWERVE